MIENEPIPDAALVFRRVHPDCWTKEGRPQSSVMADVEMSVDWEKYSTIEEAARRGSAAHGAVALSVALMRSAEFNQQVNHDPLDDNPAHSLVLGQKPPSLARKIAKHAAALKLYRPA
ncbi:MAG TPA: hypothetical protein VKX17_24280 [Planctomycetota bacterium]|nr:hypothetical protein [Planctomycetota bacterium]